MVKKKTGSLQFGKNWGEKNALASPSPCPASRVSFIGKMKQKPGSRHMLICEMTCQIVCNIFPGDECSWYQRSSLFSTLALIPGYILILFGPCLTSGESLNYWRSHFQYGIHSSCATPSIKNPARNDGKCVWAQLPGSQGSSFTSLEIS